LLLAANRLSYSVAVAISRRSSAFDTVSKVSRTQLIAEIGVGEVVVGGVVRIIRSKSSSTVVLNAAGCICGGELSQVWAVAVGRLGGWSFVFVVLSSFTVVGIIVVVGVIVIGVSVGKLSSLSSGMSLVDCVNGCGG